MNPSVLFPDLADRAWSYSPWPTVQRASRPLAVSEKRDMLLFCGCLQRTAAVGRKYEPLLFKWHKIQADGQTGNPPIVGLAVCPFCRAVTWSCDNLDGLFPLVEEATRRLGARPAAEVEKARRIYYQNIVYAVANRLDKHHGRRPAAGVRCGALESPSTEVQDKVEALAKRCEDLLEILQRRQDDGQAGHVAETDRR